MEAYSQTLALMNDVEMNDRVKMTEMKTVSRVKGPEYQRVSANKTKEERIVQKERF